MSVVPIYKMCGSCFGEGCPDCLHSGQIMQMARVRFVRIEIDENRRLRVVDDEDWDE